MKRIVILGAGFGGLEFAARISELLEGDVEVTVVDARESFIFGFSKLDMIFRGVHPKEVELFYDRYHRPGVTFLQATVQEIDPSNRVVATDRGTLEADVLVVALGADYDVVATPGLAELGREFYSVPGALRARDALADFDGGDVVIGVCGNGYKCPPAPNECALLLHDFLVDAGVRDKSTISVVIPMPTPLPPSPELSSAILGRYEERGIRFIGGTRVTELRPQSPSGVGTAVLKDGTSLPFDLFLGIPIHRAPQVVLDAGLVEDGWIPVDKASAVTRFPGVIAVGDVTSIGTPKAGVFAEGTAAAAAEALAAEIQGRPAPSGYDGTGTCYVELGQGEVGQGLRGLLHRSDPTTGFVH